MSDHVPHNGTYHGRRVNRNLEDGISLSEISDLLNARKGLILCAGVAVALLVFLHHLARPSYEARTSLLVQRPQNSPLQAMMGKMAGAPVMSSGRNNEYQDKFAAYLDSHEFRISAARKMLSLPEYEEDVRALTKRGLVGRFVNSLMYVQISDPESADSKVEDLARALKSIRFRKNGFDNIVVQAQMGNYRRAVRLVNFMSQVAVDVTIARELAELDSAKRFLEQQMAQASGRLDEVDTSIVEFRKKSRSVVTDAAPVQILSQINALKKNIEANQLKLDLNRKLIALLEKELKEDSQEILSSGAKDLKSSDVIKELYRKIQDLRYRRILVVAQGETEQSSDLVNLDNSINFVAQQLRAEINKRGGSEDDATTLLQDKDGLIGKIHTLRRENQYLDTQVETLKRGLEEASAPLKKLPEEVQTLTGFNRDAQLEFGMFGQMKHRILELELEKVSLKNKISIVENATIAGITPRLNFLPKMLLAFLLTCGFGATLAYAAEFLDMTVKSREGLIDLGLVHLGSVPKIRESLLVEARRELYRWTKWRRLLPAEINSIRSWLYNPDAPEVMAFNHVRARVSKLKSSTGHKAKSITITSSKQGEGKSYVATHLAFSMAQLECRVLLVDCDLRRSTLHKRLGISRDKGLSAYLEKNRPLEECITRNLVPGLDILPTGPMVNKPTELISGAKFSSLVDSLREKYDYILLDAPPILPVVDSLVMASLSDVVVFTASYRQTQIKNVEASIEKLHSVEQSTIYAILNNSPKAHEYIYVAHTSKTKVPPPSSSTSGVSLDIKGEIDKFRETLPSGST